MGAQADQVRKDITNRVLSRELMPGNQVNEDDLRQRLSLSGTPVREALISLEALGVVQRRPRSGAFITSLDLEDLMKMIEVLAETEGAIAYRAARRINKEQAAVLERTSAACLDFNPDREDYYDLNLDFHRAMIAAAGNEFLEDAVYKIGTRLVGYLAARHTLPGEPERSAKDHAEICAAVLDHNGDKARDLMISHDSFTDTIALDVINAVNSDREKS